MIDRMLIAKGFKNGAQGKIGSKVTWSRSMTGSKSGNKMKKMWSKKSKKFVLLSPSVKLIMKLKFKSNQVQKKLNLTNSHQNHVHLKNTGGATPTT